MFSCCHEGNLRVSNAKRGGHDEMPLRGDVIAMGVGDPFDEGMRAIQPQLAGDAAGGARGLQSREGPEEVLVPKAGRAWGDRE